MRLSLPSPSARPRWLYAFFALAAFNTLTVALGLYVNHDQTERFRESTEQNRAWAGGMADVAALAALAGDVNAPGNDVFESRDVRAERAARDAAAARFEAQLLKLERGVPEGARFNPLRNSSLAVRAAMLRMKAESEFVFRAFEAGDYREAARRMARMDRSYAVLTDEIFGAVNLVQGYQIAGLDRELRLLEQKSVWEWLVGGLVILMVVGAALYGAVMYKYWKLARAREQEQQAMAEAYRAKSAFLAQMSHELRTPLHSIWAYSELMQEAAKADGRGQDLHDHGVVLKAAAHLRDMISEILDASKIEAGKIELGVQIFPVKPVLDDVIEVMAPLAARNNNSLALELHGELGTACTDPTRLRQCLLNLMSNAVKFTRDGAVVVEARREGERLAFAVSDTGIGMPEEARARLFEPFAQRDASIARDYGGTGLGLFITRQLIEMMGGEISVESSEGVGTTFRFAISAALALAPVSAAPRELAA